MKLDLDPDNLVPLIRRIAQEVCKQFDGGQRRQGAPLAYTEPDAAPSGGQAACASRSSTAWPDRGLKNRPANRLHGAQSA